MKASYARKGKRLETIMKLIAKWKLKRQSSCSFIAKSIRNNLNVIILRNHARRLSEQSILFISRKSISHRNTPLEKGEKGNNDLCVGA